MAQEAENESQKWNDARNLVDIRFLFLAHNHHHQSSSASTVPTTINERYAFVVLLVLVSDVSEQQQRLVAPFGIVIFVR